jgi:signal peptidase II
MKTKTHQTLLYSLGALLLFIVDRVTKLLALQYAQQEIMVNPFLTFQLTINRGISWGMFHTDALIPFVLITLGIMALTGMVGYLLYTRWQRNLTYIGELLICVGSISNIIDRLTYFGVIDFIKLTYYSLWSWPIFNIADVCIVVGVCIMLLQTYKE